MQLITQDGRAYPLHAGVNTIGRGTDNEIVLNYTSVSRQHARLRWDEAGVALMDTNSVNGTAVDGRRLAPWQWYQIYPNSRLQFGVEVAAQVMVPVSQPQPPSAPAVIPAQMPAAIPAPAPQPPQLAPTYQMTPAQNAAPPVSQGSGGQRIESPPPPARPLGGGLDLLLRAIDISLDRRKLLVTLGGTALAGLLIFLALTIAGSVQRESTALFVMFLILGAALVWVVMSLTFGAVTRMCHAELSGRGPTPIREAIGYAFRRWAEFALTPLALILFLAVVGVAEVIILLIGRVDYLGELVDSLLFLPVAALNLFLVVVVAFGSSLVFPVVVDRGRGIGGTIAYVLLLVRHAPARIVFYLSVSGLLALLATWVVWGLVWLALLLTLYGLLVGLGGSKFAAILTWANLLDLVPGADLVSGLELMRLVGSPKFTYRVASFLIQAGLFVALALALAFPLVLQVSLACAVYLHVRSEVPAQAKLLG